MEVFIRRSNIMDMEVFIRGSNIMDMEVLTHITLQFIP